MDSAELERSSVDWHNIHHCKRRLLASVSLLIMADERCLQLMLMAFTEVLLVHSGWGTAEQVVEAETLRQRWEMGMS